jgi:hypothetical protein
MRDVVKAELQMQVLHSRRDATFLITSRDHDGKQPKAFVPNFHQSYWVRHSLKPVRFLIGTDCK